jgi:hypothetical protein
MKNWKTTVAGVIVAVVGFATYQQYITIEVGMSILALATALGFVVSKDSDDTPTPTI